MLKITIPETELFNDQTSEFFNVKAHTLSLEHSLVSISKWESKWCKPFLGTDKKTNDQVIDYIRCMTLTQNVDPMVYTCIPNAEINRVSDYIKQPMTATWFRETDNRPSREIITSERIYYWMIALNIPFECQKWHLNRLLTLIRVCSEENNPKRKMSQSEILKQNAALNAARRKATHSRG